MTRKELVELELIAPIRHRAQTFVNLAYQQINELPSEIGLLKELTTLCLSNNQLTSLPNSTGQLVNLTSLDLSNNQLTSLPNSIGQLVNLTSLDLSNNQLISLPNSIGQLVNLNSLNLGNNQAISLPNPIGQLVNLTSLNLRNSQLKALPEWIRQLTNLTFLDLSNNQLTNLPEWLGELTSLTTLNFRDNQITNLPDSVLQLVNLTSLDISDNQLVALPEWIGYLTNLKELLFIGNLIGELPESINQLWKFTTLDLRNHQLTVLPGWIEQLTNLTIIDLSFNQLTALPEQIGRLMHLTFLDITNNRLRTLPDSIGQLVNLKALCLIDNPIARLPESVNQLQKFTTLDLRNHGLTILPEWISQLTNLTIIDLTANQLMTLPEGISQLTNLIAIDFRGNQLKTLPEQIGQLMNLTSLNLWNNKLRALPESIGQLSNLTSLNLGCNQLTILPESIGQLINLTFLDLSNNQLEALPESIGQLDKLDALNLDSNPLSDLPPEIRNKTGLEICDYYRQRLEESTDYIYEAKLLIIGEGGAGKTSLANKLIDPNYSLKLEGSETPEKSTEGIEVLRLDFPHPSGNPFRINIWDFGGQEIYHATHQFFLTKRSLYLLIADTRQENTDFNYWLEIVELLTEASPTLIIKNEKQDRPCQINENQLRGRFPNLEKILPTNLLNNRGLPEILTAIQHHISQLPHIGQALPKTWVNVRKALETDSRNYITQDEFLTLCDTHGFKRHADKLQLSGYLHDLGVCLHFQDDDLLQRYVILKPEWGTTAVYKVLDTPSVRAAYGHFTSEDLKLIWADEQYTAMRPELLQLMKNFKLCYEIPNRPKTYIAPQLLSPNQPEYHWNDTENLILRYHYEFMPKGMITRFIVEMHRLIDRTSLDRELVWKDGVILQDNDTRAEIIEARYRNEIRIRLSGKIKKPLLEKIRGEFDKIHDSYGDRLRYQELIPCNCPTCKDSQNPHSYPLTELQERLVNQKYDIECKKPPYAEVSVYDLINDSIGSNYRTPHNRENDRYTEENPITPNSGLNLTIINQPESKIMTAQSQKIQNFNGPMSGVIASDQAEVHDNQFTQINNANTAELLKLITTMRQNAAQFPQEIQDDIIIDIDDVEAEIKKPEADRNIPKIRKRLIAILAAVSLIAGQIASATDFANNAIDVGSKLGIELHLPSATQNKVPDGKP